MMQVSAEVLALSDDPVLLVKNGRVLYANAAACGLFGADCRGQTLQTLLGGELAGVQAASFLGELELNGKRYLLRAQALEELRAFFLRDSQIPPELVSDAFLFSLREALMDMQMSSSLLKSRMEAALGREVTNELAPVNQSFYRMNRILSNLTVIRGAMQHELLFIPRAMDLSVFLRDLGDALSVLLQTPELRLDLPEHCPCRADPALLEILVLNLISNVLRHAAGATRISLRLSARKDRIQLSVDDDGCGIPASQMHTVLDRFRHRYLLGQLGMGAGLGLTAVREIARLHGGTLLLESREGSGTNVRVSMSATPLALPLREGLVPGEKNYNTILTGLADCLEESRFGGSLTE